MTAYSITVAQTMNVFGGQPPDLWNASYAVWNTLKWGYGTADVPQNVQHLITESFAQTGSVLGVAARHLVTDTMATATDGVTYRYYRVIYDTVSWAGDVSGAYVQDPAGWFHVFHPGTTNGANQSDVSWSAGATATVSWTSSAAPTTTWSEA